MRGGPDYMDYPCSNGKSRRLFRSDQGRNATNVFSQRSKVKRRSKPGIPLYLTTRARCIPTVHGFRFSVGGLCVWDRLINNTYDGTPTNPGGMWPPALCWVYYLGFAIDQHDVDETQQIKYLNRLYKHMNRYIYLNRWYRPP